MQFVLLTSRPDSPYADTPTSYEYPSKYRRFFEPLEAGEPMIAIIYSLGQVVVVACRTLDGPPYVAPRLVARASPRLVSPYGRFTTSIARRRFPTPVPRDYLGEPLERWLREHADGKPERRCRLGRPSDG